MQPRFPLVIVLIAVAAGALAAPARAEELTRVEYRHPGLRVDLGVGLWAWPIPVDFDGDGDLDLVVSCPDKPYNGAYLFENPGGANQGGTAKLPVFKPGRRISQGLPNVSPSYVDGCLRVLGPGVEYPSFLADGLEHPQKLPLPTNIHANKVRANQWKVVDFDDDGKLDIVVGVEDWTDYGWDDAFDPQGRWTRGPLHGYVYLLRNAGTSGQPQYEKPRKIEAASQSVDTFGMPSPNFADFDGDGDLDLLCGEFLDGFTYFENVGTRSKPAYAAGRRLTRHGHPLAMDLEMIVPVAIDWDGDGDQDLIVGDEDGRVALVENTGKLVDRLPQFLPPQYFQQEAADVKCGALATPVGFDWDGDGDQDIVSGNSAGYIIWLENLSGQGIEQPRWAAPVRLEANGRVLRIEAGPNGSIQGPAEAKWGYTTLSIADWDGDKLPDLIVNSIWGRVVWYRNTGTRAQPKLAASQPITVEWDSATPKPAWTWWRPADNELVTQWRTTPVAQDVNGDGLTDLVMLDHEGYLALFERRRQSDRLELSPGKRVFVDEHNQPLRLNGGVAGKSGRRKLCLVDWDGDGRLDLLLNSLNVTWYRNVAQRPGEFVFRDMGLLDSRVLAGHDTSPTTVDWNHDGTPDLLVGAEDGHFFYLRHAPTAAEKPSAGPVLASEFIYESAPFPQCHASTIAETRQGLVAAWFGGTQEGHRDVGIWLARREPNGWTPPVEVATGVESAEVRYPCWNPVLFQPRSGPLMLFYKVGPSPQAWWGMLMTSNDCGQSWSSPKRLPDGILGPIKNKPVQLADGPILCPTSSESNEIPSKWRVYFNRTGDGGKTWELIGPVNDGGNFDAIQPSILMHSGGKLQAVGRTRQGKVFQVWSSDAGQTWGPMKATPLPNPNSGTDAVTLADGRQLIVYNHTAKGRHPLNVAVSTDGKAWQAALVLESEPGEYSYPAVIQTADGRVHVTYTWKRQRVKHVVIDPAKLTLQPMIDGQWPTSLAADEGAKAADPALDPPPINTRPGPEYADNTRPFQGIPGIERAANGRLWAVWYAGGPGEGGANYVMLVTSGDDGRTWSGPKLVIDPPGPVRAYDPCLWHDPQGRLWLFWAQSHNWWDGRSGVWAITTDDSGDESPRWSAPRRLCDGIMMNKPLALSTGEWLMSAAIWQRKANTDAEHSHDLGSRRGANVMLSNDRGATWSFLGQVSVPDRVFDEHSIVERRDGSLWMLVRAAYGIGESVSTDRGKTWSEGRRATIPHVNSRFFIQRLKSGKLLLVTHNPPDEKSRSHLIAHLSDDDGQTWYGGLMIDERKGVSYPDGTQAPDGTIYLIYDFGRSKEKQILLATFTEDDVAKGTWSSTRSRQRVVINQASGVRGK